MAWHGRLEPPDLHMMCLEVVTEVGSAARELAADAASRASRAAAIYARFASQRPVGGFLRAGGVVGVRVPFGQDDGGIIL